MMLAGLYNGPEQLKVAEVSNFELQKGEARVKVSYAGICGTDMMIFSGKHPRAKAPLIMGHEFAGVVAEIEEGAPFRVGDRVAVNPLTYCGKCPSCESGNPNTCNELKYLGIDLNGGFAEYARVPIQNLVAIPESIDNVSASLLEPLAVAIHTVRKSKLKVGDTVTILGAGPIGVLIGIIAKQAGATDVLISDISKYRLDIAESFGLQAINSLEQDIVKVTKSQTNEQGADIVFEVAGNQITADQMIDAVKSQGEIVVVSVYKNAPTINLAKMHFRELSLITTRSFTNEDFRKAVSVLKELKVDLTKLVSHKLHLNDIEEGFKLMKDSTDSMKILFYSTEE